MAKKKKKFKKPPRWRYPRKQERKYKKYLYKKINTWRTYLLGANKYLQKIIDQYNRISGRSYDAYADELKQLMEDFEILFNRTNHGDSKFLTELGEEVSKTNKAEFSRIVIASMGVQPIFMRGGKERWVTQFVKDFKDRNITLIKNLTSDTLKQIDQVIHEHLAAGSSVRTMTKALISETDLEPLPYVNYGKKAKSVYQKTKKRAELISVDQIGKFNAELTKKRNVDAGLLGYTWRTVRDERVRGRPPPGKFPNAVPSHWDRRGKKYLWDYAILPEGGIPEGYEKQPPSDGFPGMPIRCRCYPEPDFELLLGEF